MKVDLTPNENDSQVLQWYKQLFAQVNAIDEKLDAGSEAAGRRKIINQLVEASKDEWSKVTDWLFDQLASQDQDTVIGAYHGILSALNDKYKESTDKALEEKVAAQPKNPAEQISTEQKKKMMEDRNALAKKVKTIVDMAETFGEFTPEDPWELPKPRRGAFGKRGKRALTLYTWSIDGVEMDEDNDDTRGVATKLGFTKVSELTAALKAAGINTTKPDPEFTAEINGHTVIAQKLTEEDVEDGDDDDETEEEGDDE